VGDSAHAIFPFFGQGLNCGFEELNVLMGLLDAQHEEGKPENWNAIAKEFQALRKPNSDAISTASKRHFFVLTEKMADASWVLGRRIVEHLSARYSPDLFLSQTQIIYYTHIDYVRALN